jgi:transcriptional regulator with XRE-family HTH domain
VVTAAADMTATELRAWMDEHGYSIRSLAPRLGVTRSTVDRWLTGRHRIPQMVELALPELARQRRRQVSGLADSTARAEEVGFSD